jgi:phage terminase large subunit-like protein
MASPLIARVAPDVARRALELAVLRLAVEAQLGGIEAWRQHARPEQLPPTEDWHTLYVRGGRGSGKTWTASHLLAEATQAQVASFAVVAPTYADARDTCVEGPSGLLAAFNTNRPEVEAGRSRYVASWNRSLGELRLRNGSVIYVDGADDGALRIQGKNLAMVWADEIGLWRRWRIAWEESIRYAVRIAPARIVATGTPKRGHELVRLLMADSGVVKRLLRTLDNVANLDASIVAEWQRLYGGTALGRQELEGEVLEDVPGAAWQRGWVERFRMLAHPELARVTVGIDPAITSTEGADQTGIVAAAAASVSREWCERQFAERGVSVVPDSHGTGSHEHFFVLEDASAVMTPSEWGHRAISLYRRLQAGRIVGETNRGGEMIEHTLRTVDRDAPFKAVHATRGKSVRAEPIAALYEQGKVHHVGFFPELEDQMCSYVAGDSVSPDRMDALVWALTDLAVKDEPGLLTAYRMEAERRRALQTRG